MNHSLSSSMLLVVIALAGCGGGAGNASPKGGRLLPLAEGAQWVYRVTDEMGVQAEKKNTVEGIEDVGGRWAGTQAYRVRTDSFGGVADYSWQKDTGTAVWRLRDQTFGKGNVLKKDEQYMPYKLRVDETRTAAGTSWTERYQEFTTEPGVADDTDNENELWKVVASEEQVTVPAGTFRCVHVTRIDIDKSEVKDFWFAPGVGKVKESGSQVEELASYTVP